jgi:protein-arginine kinase activator protein McsA
MLCELCHQREATVHLTQKVPGKPAKKRHVCEDCFPTGGRIYEQADNAARLFGSDLRERSDESEHDA